jgi:hypothetical protein
MATTYCGNNANFPGLITGTHIIGTNYQCLKKGIGVGSNLPYDPQYAVPYVPIDGRRFYCGNNDIVPPTYTAIGSTSKCLATGVGIGKARKAALGPPNIPYQLSAFVKSILLYILFFSVLITVFCIFYFKKPKFLIKKDLNVDWEKFWLYYTVICLITYIFINILRLYI